MNILFVMQHAGFTFYYESTLRLLAQRGHQIRVAYERTQDSEQLERLCTEYSQITHERLPKRRGERWLELATNVRTFQDFLRYLEPRYAHATYLRSRVEEKVPLALVRIGMMARRAGRLGTGALQAVMRSIERMIPVPDVVRRFVKDRSPDVLLVTPLVDVGSKQVDYVKAAASLKIPAAACIASWDNLTNKGLMRVAPDRVFVWNETQRHEAVAMHRVPPERVVVTGAQAFDHWFGWTASTSHEAFCQSVALDPARPFVLFVGSTVGIAAEEPAYVANWIRRLRESGHPGFDRLGVLVRPHPKQWARWKSVDLSGTGNTAVQAPRAPVDAQSRSEYYDALFHSAAVVGVNTSAMIEAAIVGRPVHALLAPEFEETQEGTLHFHYLSVANGGPLQVAKDLDAHFAQIADALRPGAAPDVHLRPFVEAFVRPHGLEQSATPMLVDAIEALAPRSTSAFNVLHGAATCRTPRT